MPHVTIPKVHINVYVLMGGRESTAMMMSTSALALLVYIMARARTHQGPSPVIATKAGSEKSVI